jgi:hypothetical protein
LHCSQTSYKVTIHNDQCNINKILRKRETKQLEAPSTLILTRFSFSCFRFNHKKRLWIFCKEFKGLCRAMLCLLERVGGPATSCPLAFHSCIIILSIYKAKTIVLNYRPQLKLQTHYKALTISTTALQLQLHRLHFRQYQGLRHNRNQSQFRTIVKTCDTFVIKNKNKQKILWIQAYPKLLKREPSLT